MGKPPQAPAGMRDGLAHHASDGIGRCLAEGLAQQESRQDSTPEVTTVKITRAMALVDHIVRFYLDDGTYVDRDFAFVHGGVFEPIMKNPSLFKKIKVTDGHPSWPGEVDLCPDAILRGGIGRWRPMKFAIVGAMGTLWPGRGVTTIVGKRKHKKVRRVVRPCGPRAI